MNSQAQLWIAASNREESMARVLSRAQWNEGAVLHAHRAASIALIAVFKARGWAHTSDLCVDLCSMLEAHDLAAPADVRRAAEALDLNRRKADLAEAGPAPSAACTDSVVTESLDAVTRVRSFVNPLLTR